MNFDGLVDRLLTLYDVGAPRVTDVANERLERMTTEAEFLRRITVLGTTVVDQASYVLDESVTKILEIRIDFTAGTALYEGKETLEDLWRVDAGEAAAGCDGYVVIEPDDDQDGTTDNFRLSPTPAEDGKDIIGLVVVAPATFTYGASSRLPIPLDTHSHLLAGCKAELSDEEGRQDEAAKFESVFGAGIAKLEKRVTSRGKGDGSHRMRLGGYDFRR